MEDIEIIWRWDAKNDYNKPTSLTYIFRISLFIISVFCLAISMQLLLSNRIMEGAFILLILFFVCLKIAMDLYNKRQVGNSVTYNSILITNNAIRHNLTGREEILNPKDIDLPTLSVSAYPLYRNVIITYSKDGLLKSQELYGFPIHKFKEFKQAIEIFKRVNIAD